jgi:hypothetical protein
MVNPAPADLLAQRCAEKRGLFLCRSILLILVTWALANAAIADTTAYWRVTMDRVTVVSDGSSDRCARLAKQLITFESLLNELAGWNADYQLPPIALYSLSQQDARRVLLSDEDRRRQASTNVQIFSKFLPGQEFNIAAIVDTGSDDPLQSVLLLYAESALISGPTRRDPPWFVFGVANLVNGLMIRTDGSVLLNRNLTFEPVNDKNATVHERYDLLKLLETTASDLNGRGDYKEFVRVAREWAQFGLLTTEQRRDHYRELALLMRQGTPAPDAVKGAFGVPYEEVAAEFQGAAWRRDTQFRVTPRGAPTSVPAPSKLEVDQAHTLLQMVATRAAVAAPERM